MINEIHLLGRTGKDIEFRSLENGSVANVSLVTTEYYNQKENDEWHNLVFWNKTAEYARDYIKKGDMIHVIGRVQYETYQKDGESRTVTKVAVRQLKRVMKGKAWENVKSEMSQPESESDDVTDDLPF